jgi:hypothetical protein
MQQRMHKKLEMLALSLSVDSHQYHSVITLLVQITYYQRVDVHATAAVYRFRLSCEVCTLSNMTRKLSAIFSIPSSR